MEWSLLVVLFNYVIALKIMRHIPEHQMWYGNMRWRKMIKALIIHYGELVKALSYSIFWLRKIVMHSVIQKVLTSQRQFYFKMGHLTHVCLRTSISSICCLLRARIMFIIFMGWAYHIPIIRSMQSWMISLIFWLWLMTRMIWSVSQLSKQRSTHFMLFSIILRRYSLILTRHGKSLTMWMQSCWVKISVDSLLINVERMATCLIKINCWVNGW